MKPTQDSPPADSRDRLALVFWVVCASVLAWLLLKDLFLALIRL